jgi:Zn finger protein HypA/HybF involved in hydrogenase expression
MHGREATNHLSVLSVIPPNSPWCEINASPEAGGYLSIYYNDDLSFLPVRAVTKPDDNKSDPNLETLTYGLFSTCSKAMRSGIVNRKLRYIFFATARSKTRVLTGYYDLRWFAETVPTGEGIEYCVAAENARFIANPVPLSEVDRLCGTNLSKWFRGMRLLSGDDCRQLRHIIDNQPDAIAEYLVEIDRLERFNLKHGGFRYISWRQSEKFSWELAARRGYLNDAKSPKTEIRAKVVNSSPSNSWKCSDCSQVTWNKALLRRCPACGKMGSLQPLSVAEAKK